MPQRDRRKRGNSGPRWRAIMPKLKKPKPKPKRKPKRKAKGRK